MKIQPILEVNQKFSSFNFTDFSQLSTVEKDVVVEKDKISAGIKAKNYYPIAPPGLDIIGSFCSGEDFYIYCSDGALYDFDKEAVNFVCNATGGTPVVVNLSFQGKPKRLIIKGDGKAIFDSQPDEIDLLPTKFAECHGGRLFLVDDNAVYFGKFLNYTDFSEYGTIFPDVGSGKIVGLIKDGRELILFCQNVIYSLRCYGNTNEYTLKKKAELDMPIQEGTVAKTCDGVIFVVDRKICIYKDGKIKELKDLKDKVLDFDLVSFDGENYYSVVTLLDNTKAVCSFSLLYGYVSFFALNGRKLIANGYLYDEQSVFIKLNAPDGYNLNSKEYKTRRLDLGCKKLKRIVEICAYSKEEAIISIAGDFGKKQMTINPGYNIKKCNLLSHEFEFLFTSEKVDFNLSDVHLKFIVKGD